MSDRDTRDRTSITAKYSRCDTRAVTGPGGLSCSCCTRGDRRYSLRLHRRTIRRRTRALLHRADPDSF